MTKLELYYPIIRFNKLVVELPDDEAERLMESPDRDKAKFIYNQNEEEDLPEMTYPTLIEQALDTEYATIKRLPN